jgi:serine/threonine protein phosphatase PrpC
VGAVSGWEPVVIGRPVAPVVARGPVIQPYRPDVVADGWSSAHFEVRCASVRGAAHRFLGEPRQDECAVVAHPGTGALVAVVADGVSGAPLSHLGATVACRTVVEYLLRVLDGADAGGSDVDWPDLLRWAGWSLVEYAARQRGSTEPDPREAERLLATTLVVALVRPGPDGRARACLVRVGDSAAWLLQAREPSQGTSEAGQGTSEASRRRRGWTWSALFPPVSDPAAEVLPDGVSALPRVPASVDPVDVELAAGDVLVLGTDGFADPLADGGGAVGELFAENLASPPPMLRLAWLLDFTCETYDDDRTLVGVWPSAGTPTIAP